MARSPPGNGTYLAPGNTGAHRFERARRAAAALRLGSVAAPSAHQDEYRAGRRIRRQRFIGNFAVCWHGACRRCYGRPRRPAPGGLSITAATWTVTHGRRYGRLVRLPALVFRGCLDPGCSAAPAQQLERGSPRRESMNRAGRWAGDVSAADVVYGLRGQDTVHDRLHVDVWVGVHPGAVVLAVAGPRPGGPTARRGPERRRRSACGGRRPARPVACDRAPGEGRSEAAQVTRRTHRLVVTTCRARGGLRRWLVLTTR